MNWRMYPALPGLIPSFRSLVFDPWNNCMDSICHHARRSEGVWLSPADLTWCLTFETIVLTMCAKFQLAISRTSTNLNDVGRRLYCTYESMEDEYCSMTKNLSQYVEKQTSSLKQCGCVCALQIEKQIDNVFYTLDVKQTNYQHSSHVIWRHKNPSVNWFISFCS